MIGMKVPWINSYYNVVIILGTLLGYNLTDVNDMKNQYDSLYSSSLEDLTKYVSFSYAFKLSS